MLKIGVMVSGGGTNLQAIIDNLELGELPGCELVTVVSSRSGAYALERAKRHGIQSTVISKKEYPSIQLYDRALINHFEACGVGLIVMAGFLAMVGRDFTEKFKGKIINVHPSLIPAFCGEGHYGIIPHQKALEYGVKLTGATVHFVEYEYDSGPVILQKAVEVREDDTPETLQLRVMKEAEWKLLPQAIRLFAEGRIKVYGRKVTILPENKAGE